MPITKINITQNDKGYDLNFTLLDNSGNPLNLAGTTITLLVQQTINPALKFTGTMAIVGAAINGQCKYTVQANDFSVAGPYNAQIQLTSGTGQVITYTDIQIVAEPLLPKAN